MIRKVSSLRLNKFKIWKFFISSRLDSLLIENLGSEWSRNRISSLSIYICAVGNLLNGLSPPEIGLPDLIRIYFPNFVPETAYFWPKMLFFRVFFSILEIFMWESAIWGVASPTMNQSDSVARIWREFGGFKMEVETLLKCHVMFGGEQLGYEWV